MLRPGARDALLAALLSLDLAFNPVGGARFHLETGKGLLRAIEIFPHMNIT